MKLIGIKYCGGCNPHIDRTKLVQEIEKLLPPECIFTTEHFSGWDIGIMVCGCLTACADKPEFKKLARKWIVVAGNSVDLNNAPEKELADIVAGRIVNYPAHRAGHLKDLEEGDCFPHTPAPHSSPSTGRGILREEFIKLR